MSPHRVTASWSPVSLATMRHILHQQKGPRDLPDEVLAQAALGFLVPNPNAVHYATQRRVIGQTSLVLMTMSAMLVTGEGARTPGTMYITFVLSGKIVITPRNGPPHEMPRFRERDHRLAIIHNSEHRRHSLPSNHASRRSARGQRREGARSTIQTRGE